MGIRAFQQFFKTEAASGVILLTVAVLAIICENSVLREHYQHLLHLPTSLSIGSLSLSKSLSHWINDGLMVIFFLLVGLEIKYELLKGQLSTRAQCVLPLVAAVGGMAIPALIFLAFDHQDQYAIQGWAIPTATDIAFAIGVLSLVGNRVTLGLKIFLTALAIIDDLGAIIVIALFYSKGISLPMLGLAAGVLAMLFALNRLKVYSLTPYMVLGVFLWLFVLKSGIHATIAGVLLALTIPLRVSSVGVQSPLKRLDHAIHPYVAFGIMPIFAFFNGGLDLSNFSFGQLMHPLPAGIACGLFFGKQIGIFGTAWIAIRCGFAKMPSGGSWGQLYGVALIAGIGFTMSLFIGSLAYDREGYMELVRLGVISGSLLSGICGLAVLYFSTRASSDLTVHEDR